VKTFLRILLALIIILIIAAIIGIVLPSKIHVERSLTINAPRKALFEQVNNLRNWEGWSPWQRIDPAMDLKYAGPVSGKGASYSWNSTNRKAGKGKLTILDSRPYDSIAIEMDFMKEGKATGYYLFEGNDSGTLVTCGFDRDMGKNPFTKYIGLMMDNFVGRDLEKGLRNLDSIAGKLPPYVIEMKDLKAFRYVSIRQKCNWEDISQVMSGSYDKLMKYIQSSGAGMAGAPYAIYHSMKDGVIDLETGIPVNKELPGRGIIQAGIQNSSPAATVDYYGFYDNLGAAHEAIQDWLVKMNLELNGDPVEEYITDPTSEPDTLKWLTRIYYPVKL
jgi:effector-binding domain-containing protein